MKSGIRVVFLGTAGGSTTWPSQSLVEGVRSGISTALVVGDRIYVVDMGAGSARQLTIADPLGKGSTAVFSNLQAFFITHLHSDHTMDLSNYILCSGNQGWPDHAVPVYGPWSRKLTEKEAQALSGVDDLANQKVPGTEHFVAYLGKAFTADTVDRVLSAGNRPFEDLVSAQDIVAPTSPAERIFPVLEDDWVRVTATLVNHGTMIPAFAYRFETDKASVVLSGDTGPSENLVMLAQGSDLLIHEAISSNFAKTTLGDPPYTDAEKTKLENVFRKHTRSELIGDIARRAGVPKVVLTHLVPANVPESEWLMGSSAFDGELLVGRDLMEIEVSQER